ncbi:MAG: hypothetical protein V9G16_05265 [Nitrosomonas sp.]
MMISSHDKEAYAWIWLPEETEPVVAGRLEADNGNILFNYGKSYLECTRDKKPAIAIYEPELPLKAGVLPLHEGLSIPVQSGNYSDRLANTSA